MSKKFERSHANDCRGIDNIISFSPALSKVDQHDIESHTVNSDELRESICNLLHHRKKRVKSLESVGALPNSLISSLTDKELNILVEFFDSFENEK